jgi:hypothetical protein
MSSCRVATIGDLIDKGYSLDVSCACGRRGWMDLERVAAVAGREQSYLVTELAPKLRCDSCRQKGKVSYWVHPPQQDGTPSSRARR